MSDVLHRLLLKMLEYPTLEYYECLPEMRAMIATELSLDLQVRATLQDFLRTSQGMSLEELQQRHVNTFEITAKNSRKRSAYSALMQLVELPPVSAPVT